VDAIEAGETILRCINYILDEYPENIDKIRELEAQQCDLLHMVELDSITYPKGYTYARQLKEVRQERRKFKDENEVMRHLHEYLSNGTSKNFVMGLFGNVAKAKKRKEQLGVRVYTPRSQVFGQEPISNIEPDKEGC